MAAPAVAAPATIPATGASPAPEIKRFTVPEVYARIEPGLTALGYRKLKPLAQGGMAAIFEGVDAQGRPVVIKALFSEIERVEEQFRDEHRMNAQMSDVERSEAEKYFIATVDGAPTDLVGKDGRAIPVSITHKLSLRPNSAEPAVSLKSLSRQYFEDHPGHRELLRKEILESVRRLHNSPNGYVHRDLKPDNFLVYFDAQHLPHVKLIDLGLAAPTRGVEPDKIGIMAHGNPNLASGTRRYMSRAQKFNQPATFADDLYALRDVLWHMRRTALPPAEHGLVLRYAHPNPVAKEPQTMPDNAPKFYEPKFAFDYRDANKKRLPDRERVMAMAEFSNWPATIDEYELLLKNAEGMTIADFMKWYTPKLLELDSDRMLGRGPYLVRYNAAREYLNGTFLSATLSSPLGSSLSKEDANAIVRGAYVQYLETRDAAADPTTLGPVGPHPELRFSELLGQVDALHAQGKIDDPKELLREAKIMLKNFPHWH